MVPNYFVFLIARITIFRAIPEFIIAMILVIAVGLSPWCLSFGFTQWVF